MQMPKRRLIQCAMIAISIALPAVARTENRVASLTIQAPVGKSPRIDGDRTLPGTERIVIGRGGETYDTAGDKTFIRIDATGEQR